MGSREDDPSFRQDIVDLGVDRGFLVGGRHVFILVRMVKEQRPEPDCQRQHNAEEGAGDPGGNAADPHSRDAQIEPDRDGEDRQGG